MAAPDRREPPVSYPQLAIEHLPPYPKRLEIIITLQMVGCGMVVTEWLGPYWVWLPFAGVVLVTTLGLYDWRPPLRPAPIGSGVYWAVYPAGDSAL